MTEEALLSGLPGLTFAFILVLCRTGAVVMLLPGLGEIEPPPTVRIGLSLAITVLVLPVVAPLVPNLPEGWGGLRMVIAEVMTGLVLGWLAKLPTLALTMTGAIASTMMGLSSVVQPDPALGGQSSAIARLLGLVAPLLVLSTGLYALPLSALVGSYQLIPPGTFIPSGPLAETVLQGVSTTLALSIQLSAPFLFAGLLVQAGLGLLARLVPQLQVFTAAIPGQILGGFVLLGLMSAPLLSTWSDAIVTAWSALPGS